MELVDVSNQIIFPRIFLWTEAAAKGYFLGVRIVLSVEVLFCRATSATIWALKFCDSWVLYGK
jgi:hypothetical protein